MNTIILGMKGFKMSLLKFFKNFLFSKEPGRKEMIRYSRARDGHKKNTLYTKRYKGLIFYGISRLNKSDKFDRERGLDLAKTRAEDALIEYKAYGKVSPDCYNGCGLFTKYANLVTMKGSYYGWVHPRDVVILLQHFRKMGK